MAAFERPFTVQSYTSAISDEPSRGSALAASILAFRPLVPPRHTMLHFRVLAVPGQACGPNTAHLHGYRGADQQAGDGGSAADLATVTPPPESMPLLTMPAGMI